MVEEGHLVPTNLTLIDFGSCERFQDNKKCHLPNEITMPPKIGRNYFFASKHYFEGHKMSRRDDIIQIIYNMLYLTNPEDF
jgi:hypothetical protein